MTTATKPKTLHEQLHDLEHRHSEAHAKARGARDTKTRWEAEVHELRASTEGVEPGSPELTALKAEITARERSRIHNEGEHADAYRAAVEPYHKIDMELQAFKRDNLRGLITEASGDVDQAIEQMRDGWRQVANACAVYLAARERAHTLVTAVTGMSGQDIGWDPRVEQWQRAAADAAGDIDTVIAPQLTDLGNWKVDNQHD